jgi:hypothetical protein
MRKSIILAALILSAAICVSAQPSKKCFVNEGLKDKHTVFLTIDGTKVTGEFAVEKDYETATNYNFTGKNSANTLSINFADNKYPYQLPPKAKKGVWLIKKVGDEEVLSIKIYGKNYDTDKFSNYFADYRSCEPSYETLLKKAKRITFAKGATSATVTANLINKSDRSSFLINLAKGQKLSVEAIGCGISFFYPDKTPYEEGTAIDMWGSNLLTQTGDFLFSISTAGELNKCAVKFSTE